MEVTLPGFQSIISSSLFTKLSPCILSSLINLELITHDQNELLSRLTPINTPNSVFLAIPDFVHLVFLIEGPAVKSPLKELLHLVAWLMIGIQKYLKLFRDVFALSNMSSPTSLDCRITLLMLSQSLKKSEKML